MKHVIVLFVLFVFVFSLNAMGESYEDYKIVANHNIFNQDRTPQKVQLPNEETNIVDEVVGLYILKGIASNGTKKVIFIEDEISGESIRGGEGVVLPNGVVKDILPDKVVYEDSEEIRFVYIGNILCKIIEKKEVE